MLPQYISATNKNRLDIEHMARTSAAERQQAMASAVGLTRGNLYSSFAALSATPVVIDRGEPTFNIALRKAALETVDRDLANAGILDAKTRKPTEKLVAELSWKREEILPTPGVIVKGCLDKCDTCEPVLQKEIDLDLERRLLENEILKRQIELLEKSQEYRCCPSESMETEELPNE